MEFHGIVLNSEPQHKPLFTENHIEEHLFDYHQYKENNRAN